MRQEQMRTAHPYRANFRVIKGGKEALPETAQLVDTAWNFAYTALWNNIVLSRAEKEAAKNCIKEFITGSKNQLHAYKAFCQRVLVTRQYINSQQGRYVPIPSIWLDKENEHGFVGTKEWYKNIIAVRASLPNYKTELRAFAEAVLEMNTEPTTKNFQYWRNYFIDRKAPGLLTLFLATVANQQFGA